MRRFTTGAVLVFALAAFALGGAWGCGKKAPPSPPEELSVPRTLPG